MRPLDLGSITVEKFGDGPDIAFAMRRLLPDAPDEVLKELTAVYGDRHVDAATGMLRLAMHSFLVRTPHHTIVIDTCLGNDKERPARPAFHHRNSPYLANLAALGVGPEDVDFVMCTHMHSDHTGWNTRLENGRWIPTFPNARYIMAEREFDYWLRCSREAEDPILHGSFDDSVLPVVNAGQAVLVSEDDFICETVRIEYFTGHSPGNLAVFLEGTACSAICTGDIVHSPVQFRYPELLTSCQDPEEARASRLRLYDRVIDTSTVLLPAHFQDPTAVRLRAEGSSLRHDYLE